MSLLENLQWRYATKKYDSTKKVEQELVEQIIEAAYLAPSSSGLQPYTILEITNSELKNKIRPIADSQSQVVDCSHLLVFAAWDNYTSERIDGIYNLMTQGRGQDVDTYKTYTDRLKNLYLERPALDNFEHAARQAYISLGCAMAMAAELRVDSTPMEGFENDELDKLLNLKEKGLKSVLLLPLGYRDVSNDWLVNLKKVRQLKNTFHSQIK